MAGGMLRCIHTLRMFACTLVRGSVSDRLVCPLFKPCPSLRYVPTCPLLGSRRADDVRMSPGGSTRKGFKTIIMCNRATTHLCFGTKLLASASRSAMPFPVNAASSRCASLVSRRLFEHNHRYLRPAAEVGPECCCSMTTMDTCQHKNPTVDGQNFAHPHDTPRPP